jgi:hypothetical protein
MVRDFSIVRKEFHERSGAHEIIFLADEQSAVVGTQKISGGFFPATIGDGAG